MVNVLYAVAAFTCMLVVCILPARILKSLNREDPVERSFLFLMGWTALFTLADSLWGIAASEVVMNDTFLFIMSTVFHSMAAFTPYVWLSFVLAYIGEVRHEAGYKILTLILFAAQIFLLTLNVQNQLVFYVDEAGIYRSASYRQYLFYVQYLIYVIIALISIAHISLKKEKKSHYPAVLCFVAAPIACGIFQLIYPDAPAYSIGYALGCCIIYSFVVTDMLRARLVENAVGEEHLRQQAKLEEALELAEKASAAKSSFLFNMSHDIRTPMNAIVGFTDKALRHSDNLEVLTDCLDKIHMSGEYLLQIVNDVLDMARIESGKMELQEEIFQALDGNLDFLSVFVNSAAEKNIVLETSYEKVKDEYLWIDTERTNQLVANLLSNAIKFTEPGGHIWYKVERIPSLHMGYSRYQTVIEDTGRGMSPEFLTRIFEEFEREQSATQSGQQGTGLGMAIVKRLLDLMDGTINIESEPGKGTRVTIILNHRIATTAELQKWREDAENLAVLDDTILKNKRVLLVEDNALNREITTDLLTESGMLVEEATDGDEAAEKIFHLVEAGNPDYYDLILMDIQMPRMDGYEATRRIRALRGPEFRHLPVIALSANAFEEDKARSLEAGMDAHISKPIEVSTLKKTMARIFEN